MRIIELTKLMLCAYMLVGLTGCATKSNNYKALEQIEHDSEIYESTPNTLDCTDLVNTAYEKFVFSIDSDGSEIPEEYFTPNALKKLQEDFDYDCEDEACYAFYALRTDHQDTKPGAEDESQIISVVPAENDWYIVSYLDMGWQGITRIKIVDGKIDDYERCISDL